MSRRGGGDYDYGHGDAARTKTFRIKAYNFTSQSDMPVRPTGNYADNAMTDPSKKNEAVEDESQHSDGGDSLVDKLKDLLNEKGVHDSDIRAGRVSLTDSGYQKIAARFGISVEEAETLMNSLRSKLNNDENDGMILAEDDHSPRYSYEADGMMNVTVRDGETGEEFYYSGSKGAALMKTMADAEDGSPEQQSFLATYCNGPNAERVAESEEIDSDVDFMSEIASNVTLYNFPWRRKNDGETKLGTATAQVKEGEDGIEIKIVSVRDSEGEEIDDIDDEFEEALSDAAREFIPEA